MNDSFLSLTGQGRLVTRRIASNVEGSAQRVVCNESDEEDIIEGSLFQEWLCWEPFIATEI